MENLSVGIHKRVKTFPTPMFVVEFPDKDGSMQTRICIVIGQEVRFLSEDALSTPAQPQLAKAILTAAGILKE